MSKNIHIYCRRSFGEMAEADLTLKVCPPYTAQHNMDLNDTVTATGAM